MNKYFDLEQWNLARIIRVGMGGLVVFESIRTQQYLLGIVGLLFLIQGIMNFGCGCSVPQNRYVSKNEKETDEVTYEEIK